MHVRVIILIAMLAINRKFFVIDMKTTEAELPMGEQGVIRAVPFPKAERVRATERRY